jgi:hypothetical protein
MAADSDGSPVAGDDPAAREAWQLARLAAVPGPSVAMVLIAGLGLVVWIGGLVWFARRGATGGPNRRQALISLGVVALGASTWSFALFVA